MTLSRNPLRANGCERMRRQLEMRVAQRTTELTHSNAQLVAEVAERTNAENSLRQTQAELVEAGKLAALGQMSAALSHEFNQPLTAIRTYSENAIAFYEASKPDRARENIDRVLRLTERMAQLSKRLTRFARKSGEDVFPVDLDPVVAEALELMSARLSRTDAQVSVTGQRGLVAFGGTTRLQHVVMNLVGNALDAIPEDRRPRIGIDLSTTPEGQVALCVTDNGTGISDDAISRIFDPFFTTKEVGKGLGLGLSICFNIVRDFDGVMRASNRAEGGAQMLVLLQVASQDSVAAQ